MNSYESPRLLNKAVTFFCIMEDTFLVTCFLFMAAALFLQVCFRYLMNSPLIWSEEFARYLLVWITFFGINYGIRREKHIKLDFFYGLFPAKLQKITNLVTNVIILVSVIYFYKSAVTFTQAQFRIASSAMQIPMGLVYVSIPIGFFISSVSVVIRTVRQILEFVQVDKGEGK